MSIYQIVKKGTRFWGQKGHFLPRNLIMRAPNFVAPHRGVVLHSNICSISILDNYNKFNEHDLSLHFISLLKNN